MLSQSDSTTPTEQQALDGLRAALLRAADQVGRTRAELEIVLVDLPKGAPIIVDGEAMNESVTEWAKGSVECLLTTLQESGSEFQTEAARDWRGWAVKVEREDRECNDRHQERFEVLDGFLGQLRSYISARAKEWRSGDSDESDSIREAIIEKLSADPAAVEELALTVIGLTGKR